MGSKAIRAISAFHGQAEQPSVMVNGTRLDYVYDPNSNRLTDKPRASNPRYDAMGNTVYYQAGPPMSLADDDLGRVREINPSAPIIESMKNNFQNHRVHKMRATYGSKTADNYFLFDVSGTMVAEEKYQNSKTTLKKHYLYFNGEIVGYILNSQLYYAHNDHLGRSELLTNSSGSVAWQVENSAFGSVKTIKSGSLDFNVGFPEQYWGSTSYLWYSWHSYYDQGAGRYLQSDPIGLVGGLNTYVYGNNNSLNYIDRDGLSGTREFICLCAFTSGYRTADGIKYAGQTYEELKEETKSKSSLQDVIGFPIRETIADRAENIGSGAFAFSSLLADLVKTGLWGAAGGAANKGCMAIGVATGAVLADGNWTRMENNILDRANDAMIGN